MTTEEAIKYLQQLYPHGGGCWLDEQRIEAIGMAVRALEKMQLPTNLDEAMWSYAKGWYKKRLGGIPSRCDGCYAHVADAFKAGAEWILGQYTNLGETRLSLEDFFEDAEIIRRNWFKLPSDKFRPGDKVVVLIRKKED